LPFSPAIEVIPLFAPATTSWSSVLPSCTATTLKAALLAALAKIGGMSLVCATSIAPAPRACSCLSPPGNTDHSIVYGVLSTPASSNWVLMLGHRVWPTRRVTPDRSTEADAPAVADVAPDG